jgi:hypothetical protein
MRQGNLPLPSVTVSILPSSKTSQTGKSQLGQGSEEEEEEPLLCESYVENAADIVRVLPAKKVVTALIPLGVERWELENDGRRI